MNEKSTSFIDEHRFSVCYLSMKNYRESCQKMKKILTKAINFIDNNLRIDFFAVPIRKFLF